jgi:hypothetical protein
VLVLYVAEEATLKEREGWFEVPTVVSEQDGVVVYKAPPALFVEL